MPTPNYGYEKRQKELARKKKKEDKLKAKAERKAGLGSDGQAATDEPEPAQMAAGPSMPRVEE